MSNKKIKVHYFYPTIKYTNLIGEEEIKIVSLELILNNLKDKPVTERVLMLGEENVQLKTIIKNDDNRWELSFLKNSKDTYFISKLEDENAQAETLEEDEFVGQECCMIYDVDNRVVALQSNIKSISSNSLASFFNQFTREKIYFMPLTLQERYNNISDDPSIDYRSIILKYVNVDEINRIANDEGIESIIHLTEISNSLEAVSGKIELGVSRHKSKFLNKNKLKDIVGFFKNHPTLTRGLKVKVYENDTIRLIDLIDNKIQSEITISISVDDPKTFNKILNPMNDYLDTVLREDLNRCNVFHYPLDID